MTRPGEMPLGVAVVGAGFIARWMMEAVAVVPGAEAVAVLTDALRSRVPRRRVRRVRRRTSSAAS